jgi:hypothetical protein
MIPPIAHQAEPPKSFPHRNIFSAPNKKPQAFSRCGQPGSQMYRYEITFPGEGS